MYGSKREGRIVSTRRVIRSFGLSALVAMTLITGCSAVADSVAYTVPQSVTWVPGNYTFGIPPGAPPTWGPAGVVYICTSTRSVLSVEIPWSGYISLTDWTTFDGSPGTHVHLVGDNGDWYDPASGPSPTDAPVPPGCGKFRYFANGPLGVPYNGPLTVTVLFTKAPPAP